MRGKQLAATAALALAIAALGPGQALAVRGGTHLSGGGTATLSQVAANVTVAGGKASGTFECLMAGRSAFVLSGFGLKHNMIVHATPATGERSGSVVSFAGPARLTLDGSQHMSVHVHVWIDAASDTFQLKVDELGAAGVIPVEALLAGDFSIR